ncbi:MAG: hypothetical protein SGJ11_02245 [Phycisphaerae bacterium]|nr:hypothetical protein [Phycisphaerae bacterium]
MRERTEAGTLKAIATRWFGPLLGAWVTAIAAGSWMMARYEFTPGDDGRVAQSWPSGATIMPFDGRASLVMAVHPRCPCTRASIAEPTELVAQAHKEMLARRCA